MGKAFKCDLCGSYEDGIANFTVEHSPEGGLFSYSIVVLPYNYNGDICDECKRILVLKALGLKE